MTERKLQSNCFQWFWNSFPHLRRLLFHVPNGGTRNAAEANLLKASGVVSGVCDIIFLFNNTAYLFEFKEPSGKGVLSDNQKKFIAAVQSQKFEVWIIEDEDFFKNTILEILERKTKEVERYYTKEEFFYKTKIFQFLYSLEFSDNWISLEKLVSEETKADFINVVLHFIEKRFGYTEGFEIIFSDNFTAIKKQSLK